MFVNNSKIASWIGGSPPSGTVICVGSSVG